MRGIGLGREENPPPGHCIALPRRGEVPLQDNATPGHTCDNSHFSPGLLWVYIAATGLSFPIIEVDEVDH